jgi:hypothetical protein
MVMSPVGLKPDKYCTTTAVLNHRPTLSPKRAPHIKKKNLKYRKIISGDQKGQIWKQYPDNGLIPGQTSRLTARINATSRSDKIKPPHIARLLPPMTPSAIYSYSSSL